MEVGRVAEALARAGLHYGRMVSYSKSQFIRAHPDRAVVFNAHVCLADGRDAWFGDLDLTVDEAALARAAADLGEALFVMAESEIYGRRFGVERSPETRAVLVARPDGAPFQPDATPLPFTRDGGGRLVVPPEWRRPPEQPAAGGAHTANGSETQPNKETE